jgi:1A family penicillin-binding protein
MIQSKRMKKLRGFWGVKNIVLVLLLIGFFIGGIVFTWISTISLPSFTDLENQKLVESTKIYDRTGEILLYDVHQDIKRTIVPLDSISRYVRNATVAAEDSNFYQHKGIEPLAILRAVFIQPLRGKGVQGGSTITQQVVKNSLLTNERSLTRKIKEWILAIRLEQVMNKDQILALYLNGSPYGGNIYGIEEASLGFFGKHASDLTLAESAYLAALPQLPTYYSPYGDHVDDLEARKNWILGRMLDLKFISQDDYNTAIAEKVKFMPQGSFGIKAPHFAIWIRQYLEQKYGKDEVESGGLKVITTLDYDMQKKAEQVVSEYGEENEKKFNATNAGMVAIDPKTGQVLAMVGSRDYFDTDHEGNFNITIAHRQPGSTFKPFVYATAFKEGYTPDTTVFDVRTQFQTTCDADGRPLNPAGDPNQCYMPENYDLTYRGPITLKEALAQSINIPAIKTLYLAGIKNSLQTAKDLGITSLGNPNQYGLTLVLGGGEVSLLEMTSAYGVFADEGVRNPYTGILRVEDADGKVLEEYAPAPKQVLDKNIALQISSILSSETLRQPAFGLNSPLHFDGRDVAAKTGTTNDYRDTWVVGYTPSLVVGAWAGNNDNTPMEKKVAGFVIAPMWHAFVAQVLPNLPDEKFEAPDPTYDDTIKPVLRGEWRGGEVYTVDKISGGLATEYTPPDLREQRVITNVHDILYWVNKNDPRGPIPDHPENDPQFNLWEIPVLKWATEHGIKNQTAADIPQNTDNVHGPQFTPSVSITSPGANENVAANARIIVSVAAQAKNPLKSADFFLDDTYIGSSTSYPFKFSFVPSGVIDSIPDGSHQIKVVVYDSVLNKGTQTIPITISSQ